MPTSVMGQTQEKEGYVVDISSNVCEENANYVSRLVNEAIDSKERVFVISKVSKGESNSLGWRRLMTAYYVLTTTTKLPSGQVVLAQGNKTTEKYGRLEFYLGGKLFLVSEAARKRNVCLSCCPGK